MRGTRNDRRNDKRVGEAGSVFYAPPPVMNAIELRGLSCPRAVCCQHSRWLQLPERDLQSTRHEWGSYSHAPVGFRMEGCVRTFHFSMGYTGYQTGYRGKRQTEIASPMKALSFQSTIWARKSTTGIQIVKTTNLCTEDLEGTDVSGLPSRGSDHVAPIKILLCCFPRARFE